MAHPFGANFREYTAIVNYRIKRWFVEARGYLIERGENKGSTNMGNDIFLSSPYADEEYNFNNRLLQGEKSTLLFADLRLQFLINPKTNMHIFASVTFRDYEKAIENDNQAYISFGIRSLLRNMDGDFW